MASATTIAHDTAVDWLKQVQAEYLEMPGLHLTPEQARRLWRLDATTSHAVLEALVDARFLRRTDRGSYVRADTP